MICSANQWTGFYMITTSVLKELKQLYDDLTSRCDNFVATTSCKNSEKINASIYYKTQKKIILGHFLFKKSHCKIFPQKIISIYFQPPLFCWNLMPKIRKVTCIDFSKNVRISFRLHFKPLFTQNIQNKVFPKPYFWPVLGTFWFKKFKTKLFTNTSFKPVLVFMLLWLHAESFKNFMH